MPGRTCLNASGRDGRLVGLYDATSLTNTWTTAVIVGTMSRRHTGSRKRHHDQNATTLTIFAAIQRACWQCCNAGVLSVWASGRPGVLGL